MGYHHSTQGVLSGCSRSSRSSKPFSESTQSQPKLLFLLALVMLTRAVAAQLWLLIYDAHLWSVLQVPMLVVFGKPIELPKMDHPSKEEIQKYLQLYINAMQALCQKHKDSAGYGGTTFKVV